ncbi:MAG TPA: NPCBM/NEW2 domain-containing protein [Gemmataceae bacterium]|nr:NPCBM/NEW2 domain-containing protein [Gemmataceae bacterium]
MHVRVAFLALSFSVLTAWSAEPTAGKSVAKLYTLKGESLEGDLANITDKEIVLQVGGRSVATPLPEILNLVFPAVTPIKQLEGTYSDIELTDGSRLHCKEWTIKAKQVQLKTMAGQQFNIPLSAVANILNNAQEEKYRKDWVERVSRKRRRDAAVRIVGDTINSYEGTFGDADAEGKSIEFQTATGKKGTLRFSGLHGLIFQRELDPQAPPLLCKLYDSYHDFIMVSSVVRTPAGLSVKTPSGAQLDIAQDLLTRLDYTLDKIAFLSRLEPSKVVQTSNFDFVDTYRRDKNLDNGPLRLYGKSYTMGLALHAHTELEYDLRGDYREFHAVAGIDQSVGGLGGPVVLVIEGVIDGATKELYKKTFTRQNAKDEKDGLINLTIKDVQKLRIIVRTGDMFDNGKHLDLVNAKVQK